MQGYLIDKNGSEYLMPELLSWDVCHGLGEPCDFFEVRALYDSSMLTKLFSAVRFKGKDGGKTVFYGVVDEYVIDINDKGATVTVNGRSLAALLMDNEVTKQRFFLITKQQLLDDYVRAFGVTDIASNELSNVSVFQVKDGDSAWSVLKRYCIKAGRTEPRFTRSGKLILDGAAGEQLTVDADGKCCGLRYKDERYGVISHIDVKNRSSGAVNTVTNDAFIARGGSCRRYTLSGIYDLGFAGLYSPDESYTGEYCIEKSKKGKHCIEFTVPQQFFCFAGDTVSFSSTDLGVSGTYRVYSTHCWADSVSAGTVVTLEIT